MSSLALKIRVSKHNLGLPLSHNATSKLFSYSIEVFFNGGNPLSMLGPYFMQSTSIEPRMMSVGVGNLGLEFFEFLRFKYKADQLGARLPLVMPDLFGGT